MCCVTSISSPVPLQCTRATALPMPNSCWPNESRAHNATRCSASRSDAWMEGTLVLHAAACSARRAFGSRQGERGAPQPTLSACASTTSRKAWDSTKRPKRRSARVAHHSSPARQERSVLPATSHPSPRATRGLGTVCLVFFSS